MNTPPRFSLPLPEELDHDTYEEQMQKGFRGLFCEGWKQSENSKCGAPAKVKVLILHGARAGEWLVACGTHKHICKGLSSRASNSSGIEPIAYTDDNELDDDDRAKIKEELCLYIKQPPEQLDLEIDKKQTVINFKIKLLPASQRVVALQEDKKKAEDAAEEMRTMNKEFQTRLAEAEKRAAYLQVYTYYLYAIRAAIYAADSSRLYAGGAGQREVARQARR